ncbi:MAG: NAD(P)H-hydrate epimerase [Pseudomonadota bacterium]
MTKDHYGFPISAGWPEIDAADMAEVDLLMIESYGITLPQMMENAGRALATLARGRFLGGQVGGQSVTALAGAGSNGGGALAAARRLAAWGARVTVVLTQEASALTPVPAQQLSTLRQMGIAVAAVPPQAADLILDGLIGYSLKGEPRGRALDLIRWANSAATDILALDVPSGLDAQGGFLARTVVHAAATLTLALPKRGLQAATHRYAVGDLYLADISVPPALYERLSTPRVVAPFALSDILRLPT